MLSFTCLKTFPWRLRARALLPNARALRIILHFAEESLGMGFDGGPSNLLVRATFNIERAAASCMCPRG
jgi:hypothetical protein